jgi:hypothetical protein
MESLDNTVSQSRQTDANFRLLVLDILWFGLALPSVSRFLGLYTIKINDSPTILGLQSSLPAIIALVTSGLALWWRGKFANINRALLWPGLGYRLMYLLPAFTPFFPKEWQPVWLVASVSIPAIPQGISSVLFLVLMREAIGTPRRLTTLTSRRSMTFNVSVGIATLFFGLWLEQVSFPHNYQIMFVTAFLLSLGSLACVQRTRPLVAEILPSAARPAVRPWRSLAFRRVAVVTMLTNITASMLWPIVTLRLVEDLGADEGFMSIFSVAELTAAALAAALTDRAVRRFGSLNIITLGMIGTALSALMFALLPDKWLTLPAAALNGACWTMTAISVFGYFSENTPPDALTPYSTRWNQVVMVSMFIGPMLGSQLASTISLSFAVVLLIGATLRALAGGWIAFDSRVQARRAAG